MSEPREHLLGIDLGTNGAKAGVIDPSGSVVCQGFREYRIASPRPGWAEQDPHDWWSACAAAVREALSRSDIPPGSIRGIGVSGQMHGAVVLDSKGEVVRPCILWCDQRAAPQCEEINRRIGTGELARMVGNPALAGFTAPKILWLRQNEPENYSRIKTVLLPKDYINLRLTGEVATEVSDASGTLMFDVAGRRWSGEMLEALDFAPDRLPPVAESGQTVGVLLPEAARELGLAPGIPVAAGGADNACSALGMGVFHPGRVAVSIGASGTVLAPLSEPAPDPLMRLHLFCHALPGTWYLMGVMLSAGLSLRWFRDHLGQPESGEAERLGMDPYQLLERMARGAPPGCDGLLFLPYLSGERTPHADPCARGVLFGLDLSKTRAHMVRAVMEGVVFGLNDSLRIMREMGVPVQEIISGGGGSRSDLWGQIQADVFVQPVYRVSVSDSAMLGAALLGGTAAGVYPSVSEACRTAVHRPDEAPSLPSTRGVYERQYRLYRALYPALKELFRWIPPVPGTDHHANAP